MWIQGPDYKLKLGDYFIQAAFLAIPICIIAGHFLFDYSFEYTPTYGEVSGPLIASAANNLYEKQPNVNVIDVFTMLDNLIIEKTEPRFGENISSPLLGIGVLLGLGSNIVTTSWTALIYIFVASTIGGVALIGIVYSLNKWVDAYYASSITGLEHTIAHVNQMNLARSDYSDKKMQDLLELPIIQEEIRKNKRIQEGMFFQTDQTRISPASMLTLYFYVTALFVMIMMLWSYTDDFGADVHNLLDYARMIDNNVFKGDKFWHQLGIVLGLVCQILFVLTTVLLAEFAVYAFNYLFGLEEMDQPHLFLSDFVLWSITTFRTVVPDDFDRPTPTAEDYPMKKLEAKSNAKKRKFA